MKKYLVLLFALVALVSCSGGRSDVPSEGSSEDQATEDVAVSDGSDERAEGGRDGEPGKKDGISAPDGPPRKQANRPGQRGGDVESGDDESQDAFKDPGREEDGSSAAHPAPGDYLYAQRGFEKFCAGGSCERRALPEQQTVRLDVTARSAGGATVVTEASSSDDRILRTTTDYSRAGAFITDVYTRLTYRGFAFENEYHPAPPVESLRFPLHDGAAWRGAWRDSTSGSYAVRVFGPISATVGGRPVRAFQVATTTEFRGEFNGEAKTLAWIDPETKAVVKVGGSADLTSTYGRYVTEFSNALRAGPGYR